MDARSVCPAIVMSWLLVINTIFVLGTHPHTPSPGTTESFPFHLHSSVVSPGSFLLVASGLCRGSGCLLHGHEAGTDLLQLHSQELVIGILDFQGTTHTMWHVG